MKPICFLFLSVTRINPCLKQQRYQKKLQMTHSIGQAFFELHTHSLKEWCHVDRGIICHKFKTKQKFHQGRQPAYKLMMHKCSTSCPNFQSWGPLPPSERVSSDEAIVSASQIEVSVGFTKVNINKKINKSK